jgi:hypothetical protein
VPVSSPIVDSSEPDFSDAKAVLARLERYAAEHRPPATIEETYPVTTLDVLPTKVHRKRLDPATVDLFPYDLIATIVGCALTILSCASFGRPVALAITGVLAVIGIEARRRHWFPALGVNLVIGLVAGLIFVFTA